MPNHQHATMVYVLAYAGLRWGEMAGLRRGRVDILRRRIQITESVAEIGGRLEFGTTKTHQTRTVHLPPFVADMLGQHLEGVGDDPHTLVFTAPKGGPLRYRNARRTVWDPARTRAGNDLTDITPP